MNLLFPRVLNDHKAQAHLVNMQSLCQEQQHEGSQHLESRNGTKTTVAPYQAAWKATEKDPLAGMCLVEKSL